MQYFDNNENLDSKLRILKYKYQDVNFNFYSDLGVFSKDRIDYGSILLVETYLKYHSEPVDVLDVGCGYGFIGCVSCKINGGNVDMVDVNNRALHLSKMNQKENDIANLNIFNSNIYDNVTKKYDAVITNPPIRAGKSVYLTIINAAFNHLNVDGELWFVMRNNHGVKTVIKDLSKKYNTSVLKKDAGYYVVMVKNGESNL